MTLPSAINIASCVPRQDFHTFNTVAHFIVKKGTNVFRV